MGVLKRWEGVEGFATISFTIHRHPLQQQTSTEYRSPTGDDDVILIDCSGHDMGFPSTHPLAPDVCRGNPCSMMISPVRVWDKETRTREALIMATTEGMMYHEDWNKDSGSFTYDTTRAQIYRCVHCNGKISMRCRECHIWRLFLVLHLLSSPWAMTIALRFSGLATKLWLNF